MVNHIVTWCYKEEVEESTRESIANNMKKALEELVGKVPGLLSATLEINLIDSSTHDLALFTTLDSIESLVGYQKHPDHCYVADTYVKPFVCNRTCIDYEA